MNTTWSQAKISADVGQPFARTVGWKVSVTSKYGVAYMISVAASFGMMARDADLAWQTWVLTPLSKSLCSADATCPP
jgi:hypothetical protein